MSNLKLRILLIFTVLPLLFTVTFFLPYFHYLGISIVAAIFSVSGTYETWKLFYGKYTKADFVFVTIIAYSIPVIVYLESASIIPLNTVYYFSGILIFLIFSYQIFVRDESAFAEINKKTTALLVLMFYPGLFFSYTIRFTIRPMQYLCLWWLCFAMISAPMLQVCYGEPKAEKWFRSAPKKALSVLSGDFHHQLFLQQFFIL